MLIRLKEILTGSFSHDASEDFLTSQWQREKKCFSFIVYRWLVAVFFAFSVAFAVVCNIKRGYFQFFFIYLTHLNLIGTMLTTYLGAILATLHFIEKVEVKRKNLPLMVKIYWFLWNQSVVFSCLVSIFYWGLLYRTEKVDIDLNNVLVHIMNSLVLIFDLMIVKHPAKYSNFMHIVAVEVLYMIFTIVYQLAGGLNKHGENFVYSSSDWINKPFLTIIFASIFLLLSIAFYFIINFVHAIRLSTHRKLFKKEGGTNEFVIKAAHKEEVV